MVRPHNGFDPSPLLPLGVLMVVVVMVFTPIAFQVMPVVTETTQQTVTFFWLVPVLLVAALFLTSSDIFDSPSQYQRRPVYRYPQTQYGYYGEGPSWGLLGLMLLLLLLLPWRY